MSVLEVLSFRAVLEVLFQAVAALVAADGGDGRLIDDNGVLVLSSHDCDQSSQLYEGVVV
jgi:hypothetical protein